MVTEKLDLKSQLDTRNLPQHVAIIMDGNGRWAKEKGKLRVYGHKHGVESVRQVVEASVEIGTPYLTLYEFSAENWNRPKFEVVALMEILVSAINKEKKTLMKNGVKLTAIGELSLLPPSCLKQLNKAIEDTSQNTKCTLVLALSYSAKHEILEATRNIAKQVQAGTLALDAINEHVFSKELYTKEIPDPELMIRTSGEIRISNFLLWQLAYAELYFTETLWPDFHKDEFFKAILEYQKRERRFGKISEQIIKR